MLQPEMLGWKAIGGFHVTQESVIITQVKNKIAYPSINWVKKIEIS